MDIEAQSTKMKTLFEKARAARQEGKRELARSFRAGGRRIGRQIKAELIRTGQFVSKKKKSED